MIKRLGSMKLAVAILAILSVVLIWATLYEAQHSTEAAVEVFYGSWWFSALLMLLGLNVAAAAIVRYPWQRRQYGFVLTHAGILAILLGAVMGLLGGKEGYITLTEQGPAISSLTTGRELLEVGRSGEDQFLKIPLDLDRLKKSQKPVAIQTETIVPADTLQAAVVKRLANSREETIVSEGKGEFAPALQIGLRPPMGDEDTEISEWLVADDPERTILQMGPLLVRILKAENEAKLERLLHPVPLTEAGFGEIFFDVEGTALRVPVKDSLGKEVKSQDGKITVALKEYYPDFKMDSDAGKPVTASEDPNNPCAQYEISWGSTDAPKKVYGFVFADYPELGMSRVEGASEEDFKVSYEFDRSSLDVGLFAEASVVSLIAGPGKALHYMARRPGEERQFGTLELNEVVPLDTWKMNPGLRVKTYLPSAQSRLEIVEVPLEDGASFASPALELQLTGGGYTTNIFVQWNRPFEIIAGANTKEQVPITFFYTEEKIPLGFQVQLLKFNMPTFEGTQMAASYESLIRVTNEKSGDALERKVWMNHPMSYGGYRISQSGYSQAMGMTRSTLQLLSDPGSWLKWLGSILMMLGMGVMYFWNPDKKRIAQSETELDEI